MPIFLSKKDQEILKTLKLENIQEIVKNLNFLLKVKNKLEKKFQQIKVQQNLELNLKPVNLDNLKILTKIEWQFLKTNLQVDYSDLNLLLSKIQEKIANLKKQASRQIEKAWKVYQKDSLTKTRQAELEKILQKRSTKDLCQHYQIKLCEGICGGLEDLKKYHSKIKQIEKVLNGQTDKVQKILEKKMRQAAQKADFRLAALYRDRLDLLETIKEKQIIVLPLAEDLDLLTLVIEKQLQDSVYLASFFLQQIRQGRLINVQNFLLSGSQIEVLETEEFSPESKQKKLALSFLQSFLLTYNLSSQKPIILETFFVN